MLSKSAAKTFFLLGTAICGGAFLLLTLDTVKQVPIQTKKANLTASAIRGKHLWDRNNCMGCHTLLGEGAYYAPELTKVYSRRGEAFIRAMLEDPEKMYPNQRKMVKYDFSEEQKNDLIAFFKWVDDMDLNGFPPKPDLGSVAVQTTAMVPSQTVAKKLDRPQIFNQMCVACHTLGGQGGTIGPALDNIGNTRNLEYLTAWLKDPVAVKPDSKMPKMPLSEADIVELAAFLSQHKSGGAQ